jgi:hypothetical protein
MVKKFLFALFFVIIFMGVVSAIDTSIKIKTLPVHRVSVFVYPAGQLGLVDSYHLNSDLYGDLEVKHTSSIDEIDVLVKVSKDGDTVLGPEKFKEYDAGFPINIRIDNVEITGEYVEEVEEVVNETVEEEVNETVGGEVEVSVKDGESGSGITGEVISGSDVVQGVSKSAYIAIAVVLLIFVVVFLAVKRFAIPAVGIKRDKAERIDVSSVMKMKSELKEAEREIRKLKNQEKVKEIERKIQEEKDELEKLQRGDED